MKEVKEKLKYEQDFDKLKQYIQINFRQSDLINYEAIAKKEEE